ncbi:Nn.00g078390.m01.CDS01 [Neocucurbitaria sp. VM-36]
MQRDNHLLQLPRELRDEIFALVFNSTRLTFGLRYTPRHGERFITPAPHSLALLRTCRQIHGETHDVWIGRVLFNFEDPQTMLNRLSELPESTVSKIRHLRLAGFPMMRYLKGFDDLMYRHDSVFQLLPALRLDCLTILAVPPAAPEYDAITNLINRGNGWKELRYITRSSRMLGFSPSRSHGSRETGHICRQPQPKAWNERIVKRDNEGSGASVQIFRSKEENDCASVLCPHRRKLFEQSFDNDKIKEFGLIDDEELTKGAGARKALLVLVKRGNNADITQRTGFSKERDMKSRFNKRSWRHRKKVIIWTPLDQEKEDDDDMGNGWARPLIRPPQQAVDNYYDIDEM